MSVPKTQFNPRIDTLFYQQDDYNSITRFEDQPSTSFKDNYRFLSYLNKGGSIDDFQTDVQMNSKKYAIMHMIGHKQLEALPILGGIFDLIQLYLGGKLAWSSISKARSAVSSGSHSSKWNLYLKLIGLAFVFAPESYLGCLTFNNTVMKPRLNAFDDYFLKKYSGSVLK